MERLFSATLGALICCLFFVGLPLLAHFWLTARVGANGAAFALPFAACLLLSAITPFSIIAIRTQVRLTRVRMIELFARLFNVPTEGRDGGIVSFEFVRGKYFVDLPSRLRSLGDAKVPRFPMLLHADWMLLFCALPYMVFSAFGIFLLFAPEAFYAATGPVGSWLKPSLLAVGGADPAVMTNPAQREMLHQNILLVAALAFAGAYFYTLRLFLRAVVTFDLSPITFLRAFAHMVLSVIMAVVLYRALPSGQEMMGAARDAIMTLSGGNGGSSPAASIGPLALPWMLLALGLGFLPDTAIFYVLRKSGLPFKERENGLDDFAKIIPLTLLDGIDHFIAFRLEEANIYDVQNLATYNPIMLHVESPYGIYQTVDWVAQAQLCAAVGPNRFLALRSLNIRTIFDLRRAVLGRQAPDEPPMSEALTEAIADALLIEDKRDKSLRERLGHDSPTALQRGPDEAGAQSRAEREAALRRMVWMMINDLHVHRLEQVWNQIYTNLVPKPAKPNRLAIEAAETKES